jgi:hypothetical protein
MNIASCTDESLSERSLIEVIRGAGLTLLA